MHFGAANRTHSVAAAAVAFAAVALGSPNSGSDSIANAAVSQCSQRFDDDTAVDLDVDVFDRVAFASSSWEALPAYCASERIAVAVAAAVVEHNVEDQHIGAAAGACASRRKVARRRDRSRTKAAAALADCDVALEDAIVERWAVAAGEEEDHGSTGGEEELPDSTDTTSVELAGVRAAVVPAEEVGVVAAAAADGDDQTLYATFREF